MDGLSQIIPWLSHVDSIWMCATDFDKGADVNAFNLFSKTRSKCRHDVSKTGLCKKVWWSLTSLTMTVNFSCVCVILWESYQARRGRGNVIKRKQYITVLIIFNTPEYWSSLLCVWSAWPSCSGPEDMRWWVYTVIIVRQLRGLDTLLRSRTNWSFNY